MWAVGVVCVNIVLTANRNARWTTLGPLEHVGDGVKMALPKNVKAINSHVGQIDHRFPLAG